MKIALGCDHGALALKTDLIPHLEKLGYEVKDFGTYTYDSCDYPDFAGPAAQAVASGECEKGILICGTGIGMSICANKVDGIRAAVCSEAYSCEYTRLHNDANVIVLPGRFVTNNEAEKILDTFFKATFEGGRHQRRVEKIGGEFKLVFTKE